MALPDVNTVNRLTRCKVYPGVFPGGFCDQFIRKIAFESVQGYGRAIQINRGTLGAAITYDPGDALPQNVSSVDAVAFGFERLGDSVEVDAGDISGSAPDQDQLDVQRDLKRVAVVRLLAQQVIQGDGAVPNLAGLTELADAAQTIDPAAGAGQVPTLDDFHRLLAKVCASDGMVGAGPDALVMHPRTRRLLISLLEAAGGPEYRFDEALGVPVPLFDGIPVYISQVVAVDEDTNGDAGLGLLTSVYAIKMTGPTGIRVLHSGGDSGDYGLIVEPVPMQPTPAVRGYMVRGYYALLCPEIGSLARLKAINIAGFPA